MFLGFLESLSLKVSENGFLYIKSLFFKSARFSDSSRFSTAVPPTFSPKEAFGADFGPKQNFQNFDPPTGLAPPFFLSDSRSHRSSSRRPSRSGNHGRGESGECSNG